MRLFAARNGRPPSPGNLRNLISIADHAHLLVSVRTSPAPWWSHDIWDLHVDDRIPRRLHEPAADQIVNLGAIDPPWFREALRFWLSTSLTYQIFRWTTVTTRARNLGTYLGRYLTQQHITDPTIAATPAEIRAVFTGFTAWLSSPAATTTGRPLAGTGVWLTLACRVPTRRDAMFVDSDPTYAPTQPPAAPLRRGYPSGFRPRTSRLTPTSRPATRTPTRSPRPLS